MNRPRYILPVIVIAQFCCTSLWFAGNGVINDLAIEFGLQSNALGHLTSAVQLGFIVGTLVFAILSIADRYYPSRVFLFSALFGACFNLGIIVEGNTLFSLLILRFFTGFFLAGIYPVGMKIAADYYEKGLGKALGFLVGALVVGTAFPHLLKEITQAYPWRFVVVATSLLAGIGGLLMVILVPNGPYRKSSQTTDMLAFYTVFKNRKFRSFAYGYFGHMWELYAFWAFVPIIIRKYMAGHPQSLLNVPILSFIIIAIGGLACILSGYLAQKIGNQRTAFLALFFSCGCCLISPWIFSTQYEYLFIGFLVFWGIVVVADSPLLSTMVAQNATPEIKGTALTIVNCLGFTISIISIQLISGMLTWTNSNGIYAVLAIGPIMGLMALRREINY